MRRARRRLVQLNDASWPSGGRVEIPDIGHIVLQPVGGEFEVNVFEFSQPASIGQNRRQHRGHRDPHHQQQEDAASHRPEEGEKPAHSAITGAANT